MWCWRKRNTKIFSRVLVNYATSYVNQEFEKLVSGLSCRKLPFLACLIPVLSMCSMHVTGSFNFITQRTTFLIQYFWN